MKSDRLLYKELSFLENEYNFNFLIKLKGIDERFCFQRDNFEIGFYRRISQFENKSYLYYCINSSYYVYCFKRCFLIK